MDVRHATLNDLDIIKGLACQTWPHAFRDILSEAQIKYMLEMMYSIPSLEEQMEKKGHRFLLAMEDEKQWGFAAYEHNYKGLRKTKIHKLYILPQVQGKGAGRSLIGAIAGFAATQQDLRLTLNVNKHNPAILFYEKMGFKKTGEECLPIGNGFVMDDVILEKPC